MALLSGIRGKSGMAASRPVWSAMMVRDAVIHSEYGQLEQIDRTFRIGGLVSDAGSYVRAARLRTMNSVRRQYMWA